MSWTLSDMKDVHEQMEEEVIERTSKTEGRELYCDIGHAKHLD